MTATRLLVVDDDPDVLTFVRSALGGEMHVDTASSAVETLGRISELSPDIVLLDVRMPEMGGLELLRELKERGFERPVILMTSFTAMDAAVEAMKAGAHDFVTKPLRPGSLLRLLRGAEASENGDGHGARARVIEAQEAEPRIVGRSPEMVDVFKRIGKVSPTRATVLVTGESGTGKELVARAIHDASPNADGPFLAVNCAAIPAPLLESELFGHEEGAFTDAKSQQIGKFEQAREGTIFLDEVGKLPVALQGKLLRALEQRVIERLGGSEPIEVKARLLAASNQDLEKAVEEGRFREDLYYRLAVVEIRLPPLRERTGDIPLLVDYFVRRLAAPSDRAVDSVSEAVYERLESYGWPGNVRQLRNVVERGLVLGRGPVLTPGDLPDLDGNDVPDDPDGTLRRLYRRGTSLEELERRYLETALREEGWNAAQVARVLDVHPNTVRRKRKGYGLGPSSDGPGG